MRVRRFVAVRSDAAPGKGKKADEAEAGENDSGGMAKNGIQQISHRKTSQEYLRLLVARPGSNTKGKPSYIKKRETPHASIPAMRPAT